MPIYFFDIHDGEGDRDYEGVELPDLYAARAEAIKFAGDFVRNDPSLLDGHKLNIKLLDENRAPLYRVTISLTDLRSRGDAPQPV